MQNLTQPTLLLKPFAESGDKNTIPDVNSDPTNPQLADLTEGFPEITSFSPDNGGLPPERKDFNGLGYLTTTYDFFYQAGGTFTYNTTIATAIGGYPAGARLWYTDSDGVSSILRSTIDNNTNNFLNDPSVIGKPGTDKPWVIESFTGINTGFQILSFQWSDHLLNDVQWLRADTFSWQDGTVYYSAYNHLVDDLEDATTETEIVGGVSITYYLAKDGHKIVDVENQSAVESIYISTGSAWYFIIDTTNEKFKLPRENPAREELIQVVRAKGNGKSLGITDGTNNGGLIASNFPNAAYYNYVLTAGLEAYGQDVGGSNPSPTLANKIVGITTDSTKSGVISDMTESTSVFKGHKYLYFYVGSYTKTAIEQTAGLNSEMFDEKVDVASLTECRVIVDSYVNGNSWYRKYSDGWVEQGGYSSNVGLSSGTRTINLLVEMANINYQIMRTADKGSNANNPETRWCVGANGNSRTTTSFTMFSDLPDYVAGDWWEVKGMGA